MKHDKSLSPGGRVHIPGALTMSRPRGCVAVSGPSPVMVLSFAEEDVKVRHWACVVAAVMATLLVAACGASSGAVSASRSGAPVASPPAAVTLVRQVNAAVANAHSVHIAATVTQAGSTVGLNVDLTRSNDMSGVITYKNAPLTVLVKNGRAYIKLTAGAATAMGVPPAACVLMCGKYLEMTASQTQSMLGDLGWSSFLGPSSSVPQLHYVRTVTVNGQPAWQMSVPGEGTAYVAAQGTPYPLRMVQGSDRVDFTRWNSVVIPPLPPASQVVDLSQLEHL